MASETDLFVLQHPPLLPHELENGDEAGSNHSGVEHDEDAAEIGQAELGTVTLTSTRLEKKFKRFLD